MLVHSILAVIQQVAPAPASPLGKLAFAVLTPLLGLIATRSYDGIKTAFPFFDKLDPAVHAALSPIFLAVFGFLASYFGIPGLAEVADIHGLSADIINALLIAATGAGIFRLEKRKNPNDATVVLAAERGKTVRVG